MILVTSGNSGPFEGDLECFFGDCLPIYGFFGHFGSFEVIWR